MIGNYLKTAWRNIAKAKFYASVNILGLSAGIAFSFLIGAYLWSELQVNKRLLHADRQYILTTISKDPNVGYELATFGPIAKRLKQDYPNLVANYYRYDGITSVVSKGDRHFREGLQVGDSTLLNMYGFQLQHGDIRTALNQPYSAVISKEKAIKYFGKTQVIGETLTIQSFSGGKRDFTITGVLEDYPENSVTRLVPDYPNQIFIPHNTLTFFGRQDIEAWFNLFIPSYIELKEGKSAKDLEIPLRQMVQAHADASLKDIITVKPVLLTDYYLQKDKGLVKRMLLTLSAAGIFILIMAGINFVNITISRSSTRMREIGVRKVLGGIKRQLIIQFLTESYILVLLSTMLALVMYSAIRPLFGELVGKEIPGLTAFPLYLVIPLIGVIILISLLAGFYPALVLSSFKSVDSLKGKLKTARENQWLRKSLAGFQFAIAFVALAAAFIVTRQVSFFFGQNLGYDKEFIVSAQVPRNWSIEGLRSMKTVRDEFGRLPQVSSVSLSFEIPDGKNGGQVAIHNFGSDAASANFVQLLRTDENYATTYKIPLKAGRFFDGAVLDSARAVINERTLTLLNYKTADEAIGRQLRIPGDPTIFTIIGVTRDFHFGSMQQAIQPILFLNVSHAPVYRFLSFKIKPGNIHGTITAIQQKWAGLLPGSAFEYSFMDDSLRNLYRTEIQLKKAAYTATALALIIVLLGVLGLVSLNIHKRSREIGIRKVLGASVPAIIALFLKEFLVIVLAAGIIACPLAYLLMRGWLNNYAYRIDMTPWPFLSAMFILMLGMFVLIVLKTARAALTNPVNSLKTE